MAYNFKSLTELFIKLDGAYAPNTLKSYYDDAKSFVDWCDNGNIEPFPLTSAALCGFIE